jgi:hypothetical protein
MLNGCTAFRFFLTTETMMPYRNLNSKSQIKDNGKLKKFIFDWQKSKYKTKY